MTLFKRHVGRRMAAMGVATALLVLGLAAPAYAGVPTVTAVTPANAALGCEVTVTGTNFQTVANGGPANDVRFGGTSGTGLTIDADTQLEVTVPPLALVGSNPVVVFNGDGFTAPAFPYSSPAITRSRPG